MPVKYSNATTLNAFDLNELVEEHVIIREEGPKQSHLQINTQLMFYRDCFPLRSSRFSNDVSR